MSEEKRILEFFGVSQIEGNVRGEHLGKLLTLLKINSGKRFDFVLRVAPLILGMQRRYIKENYLEGLIELGVIKLAIKTNVYYYEWFGDKALNGSVIPSEPEQIMKELTDIENIKEKEVSEPKKEEKKEDKSKCPNCGKKLKKNKKYCNEECLRGYYDKKKKEKKVDDNIRTNNTNKKN